jgi:hypothetical protein
MAATEAPDMCRAVDDNMCDIVDGVADDALFDHMARCERCRDARFDAAQVLVLVADAASDYRIPDDLMGQLATALEARRESRPSRTVAALGEQLGRLQKLLARDDAPASDAAHASLTPPAPPAPSTPRPTRAPGSPPSARWAWLSLLVAIALAALWLGSRRDAEKVLPHERVALGGGWPAEVREIERAFGSPSGLSECARGTLVCRPLAVGEVAHPGMRLETDGLTRALLKFADGSQLSLDRQSRFELALHEPRRGRLIEGNLVAEIEPLAESERAGPGEPPPAAVIELPVGWVEVMGTKFSLRASEDSARVEVSRGSVKLFDTRERSVIVRAGEAAVIGRDGAPRVENVVDLARALAWSTSAFDDAAESGRQGALGELIAKRPRDGRELSGAVQLSQHHVSIRIVDNMARTQVEEVFENHADEVLEGIYRFPLPPGAQIERLALEVDGQLVDGAFVDRERAAAIWRGAVVNAGGKRPAREDIVWVPGPWRDPALLEWQRGGRFELRVFPIPARGSRRIVLAYTETLAPSEGARAYVYPLPRDPRGSTRIAHFSAEVQVRGHDLARGVSARGYPLRAISGSPEVARLAYDQKDFVPSGDLAVTYELAHPEAELRTWVYQPKPAAPVAPSSRAMNDGAADGAPPGAFEHEADVPPDAPFVALALKPSLPRRARDEARDYVLVADTSRSMIGESHRRAIKVIAHIIRELDRSDRVALLACDASCQALPGGYQRPGDASADAAARFLEGIEPEGASDLALAVERAAALRDREPEGHSDPNGASERNLRVIYVGDGSPTVGPIHPALLEQAIAAALPRGASFSAVAVGSDADRGALRVATRAGGGVMVPFSPGVSAEDAAYAVLGASYGHSLEHARLQLPEGAVLVMPKRLGTIAAGAEELVVARLTRPSVAGEVVLSGEVAGEPFERRFAVELVAKPGEANAFVPRLYAGVAIAELEASMDESARRRSIELSTRYGVASRYTSLLVLESPAMFTAFGLDRRRSAHEWSGDEESQKSEAAGEPERLLYESEPVEAPEAPPVERRSRASEAASNGASSGRAARAPARPEPSSASEGADGADGAERAPARAEAALEPADDEDPRPEEAAVSSPSSPASIDPYAEGNPYGADRKGSDRPASTPEGEPEPLERELRRRPVELPQRRLVPMRRVWDRVAKIDVPASPLAATSPERRHSLELRARQNAESRDALRSLFVVDFLAGDLDAAARAAQHWAEKDPLDVDALTARADLAAQRGDRELAIRILGSVVDVRPGDYKAQWRLARLHRWAGHPERGCRHSLAVAQLMLRDAKLVSEAVGCAREVGQGRAADHLLAALEPNVRREVERLTERRRTSDELSGDFRVLASWQGAEHDVDVAILSPEGYRVSWLGAPTRAVITASDVLSQQREGIALRGAPPGEYVIELVRSSAAPGPIRGNVQLLIANAERIVPFAMDGERARLATVRLRNEPRLVPIEAWE